MFPKTFVAAIMVIGLGVSGCAGAPAATAPAAPAATAGAQLFSPLALPETPASGEAAAATAAITPTPGPFALDLTPVPSETALPTLDLPTEVSRPPALQIWDGAPTYPAESRPGYSFRLRFASDAWALTTDVYGFPALAHRSITGCLISPTQGRGLPPNAAVDHEVRRLGNVEYDITTTSLYGANQAATYAAGDGRIYTAFQVTLQDSPDQCLTEAEAVLSTLTSVSVSEATPIATP